jgi:hypothetical protein
LKTKKPLGKFQAAFCFVQRKVVKTNGDDLSRLNAPTQGYEQKSAQFTAVFPAKAGI